MNRAERRHKSKSKWINRVKKIFYSMQGLWYIPKKGIKSCRWYNNRKADSITEVLDSSIYAKMLKNTTTMHKRSTYELEDYRSQYLKEKRQAIKDIKEQVYEYYSEN